MSGTKHPGSKHPLLQKEISCPIYSHPHQQHHDTVAARD